MRSSWEIGRPGIISARMLSSCQGLCLAAALPPAAATGNDSVLWLHRAGWGRGLVQLATRLCQQGSVCLCERGHVLLSCTMRSGSANHQVL